MSNITTYTQARANLASLCDEAASTREPIIIRRRNAKDVALISAEELESMMETAYLLQSPRNAERLLTALMRAHERSVAPTSIQELKKELALGAEEG